VSNEADYQRYNMIPAYWFSEDLRFAKYLSEKYSQIRFEHFAVAHGVPEHWSTFRELGFDQNLGVYFADLKEMDPRKLERIAKDYEAFLDTCDASRVLPLFANWSGPDLRAFLREKYERKVKLGDTGGRELTGGSLSEQALDLLSRTWNEGLFLYWDYVNFLQELGYPYHLRRWGPPDEPRQADYLDYVRHVPPGGKIPITSRYLWCLFLMDRGIQVSEIDRQYGTRFGSIYRVPTGDSAELPKPLEDLWDEYWPFVWPVRLMEIPADLAERFPEWLSEEYGGDLSTMNEALGMDLPDFEAVGTARRFPEDPRLRRAWITFVVEALDVLRATEDSPSDKSDTSAFFDTPARWSAEKWVRLCPEEDYRRFLAREYDSVSALNATYGWGLSSFAEASLPIREMDYFNFSRNEGKCVWKFTTHNCGEVLRFIAVRGRALWNTSILVVLTVLFTLTVNPLAAYALSRFRLRLTQQILVYLLATMAFPPEVGMIPGFLLLRDLHLLNTFPALILPGAANGFTIFLLKGFFDSLPQELYEAASIDGAGECRMFTVITLPLCKPILAVIALHAFIASYGSFMWAFLVCQDPDMWTLMVWLYQFHTQNPSQPLMFAAIVVASVPTLIVFIGCQKIILRGIIIPSMK
jgi:ABC-type glycerol-3-phosphate transport system permease component